MSSNLFGHYWQKGEKRMSLIVFKRVHMGGCVMFCLVFTTLVLKLFGSWVVTLKLDGRLLLLLLCLWCDDKFCIKSFCRRQFLIMHIIIFVTSYMHNAWSSHFDDSLHKAKPAICICIQTQIIYMHIFRLSLILCMKTILATLNFHILLSSLKTSTSLSSITKKGEIVSASSANPSWFWSIDNKLGWGTNVFVRTAG